MVITPACHAGGREFESRPPRRSTTCARSLVVLVWCWVRWLTTRRSQTPPARAANSVRYLVVTGHLHACPVVTGPCAESVALSLPAWKCWVWLVWARSASLRLPTLT